jgi:3-hydroxyisobutyrate dehydrogenase-like beta-hydroxyacid dehydrogenase
MRAVGLDAAWDPAAGNFTQTLRTAGAGSPIYASTQDALNQVSDALFYIEGMVKDRKLAPPLGLNIDLCTSEICPELRESLYGRSKVNLLANVDGLRRVVEGCGPDYSGFGFDDLLVAVGSPVVAETLRMRAAAIRPAIEAVEEPDLDLALVQDKASVRAVYDAFKGVTDILKVDFATILDLELPAGILGDVD